MGKISVQYANTRTQGLVSEHLNWEKRSKNKLKFTPVTEERDRGLSSSSILRGAGSYLATEILGQHIGPMRERRLPLPLN
jgi:hypothetical protein